MAEVRSYLDALAALAHPEGGWGYTSPGPAHLEPTCLALLASSLDPAPFEQSARKAWQFVEGCARGDGTYRWSKGRDEAVWPTSLVLLAQCVLKLPQDTIQRTAGALLAIEGRKQADPDAGQVQDIDLTITGWPWAEGNSSWAEPTAWACLALRHAGLTAHPRVEEGMRLLLDRTADEGGINYGNRRVLGLMTQPIPGPTAIMLLALQGHAEHPRVAASVRYLQDHAVTSTDLEHLCWSRLALSAVSDASRKRSNDIDSALEHKIIDSHRSRTASTLLPATPLRQALTALALTSNTNNVFQLPTEAAPSPHASSPILRAGGIATIKKPPRKSLTDRFRSLVRKLAVNASTNLRPRPTQSVVHIARAADYEQDLVAILHKQYETFRANVPLAGKRVVLKPNLVEFHRDKVINTDPRVVAAVIQLCRKEGASEITVAEGPGHWRNVEFLVQESGLGDVLKQHGVKFVDLNHDEPVKFPNMGRLTGLEYLYLAKTTATADVLISVPKLKTHHWAGATLSLKNLFGTLPGICYGWPKNELHWRGIDNSIVDIALTRTPELAIVDAIVGMEGDGPLNGTPRHVGALVMGTDLVAVDATCCRLMKLNPEQIVYLTLGYQRKLGLLHEKEIAQAGEKIDSLAQAFETVEHFRKLCIGRSA
jgi:uncharacterized protein (DUF362 family)